MSEPMHFGAVTYWNAELGRGEILPETNNHGAVIVFRGAFAGLPEPAVGQRFLFEIGADFGSGLTVARGLRPLSG